ncbi:Predicted DNA-binding protein, contains XRE-type HTH domain [Deinococcus reticulitermitis]|uniref:Predicted DNA-binding protein, contains XRE-type HTH domain n=1 Tax=Deinococcus reticulitermitis TaxID=856736 RepID=A0A1H7BQL1_9DEIO|nr:helix-turn-helix transcriptional regulator [Deinococcus reticulitermitis]SEJ79496.1 Predicted DNA-binding protein, contains XRE-type HTH domain [Deinococcus reticulitermitis]
MTKMQIEASSGNVFADLGIAEPEEALIQADLALAIGRHIAGQGWTQTHAARVLGVQQSDVSNIVRGRLKGFSIERLVRLLGKLGQSVRVVVADRPQAATPAGAAPVPDHEGGDCLEVSQQAYSAQVSRRPANIPFPRPLPAFALPHVKEG